jgi:hypothetical protein
MLLHSETIRLDSAKSSEAVVAALQTAVAEWRESRFSATARAAHIIGWTMRIRDDRIIVRARIRYPNSSLPHFVGRVTTTPDGSVLIGELRLSWFPRVFTLVWLSLAGGAPVIALFGPIPGAGVGEHIFAALFMVVPAIGV